MAATLPGLSLIYDRGVLHPAELAISRRGVLGAVDSEGEEEDEAEGGLGGLGGGEAVNGEVVRGGLERYRKGNLVKAGMVGVAFLVGVVGNWGDGWVGYGL